MTQEHPITPSEDQIMLWCKQWNCTKEPGPIHKWLAIQAARWGADQELEACCEWLCRSGHQFAETYVAYLRAARRPKPPSLKEAAREELRKISISPELGVSVQALDTIRRAIESLPD